MYLLRLTAFIAVIMVAFACESTSTSKKALDAEIPNEYKGVAMVMVNNKPEEEQKGDQDFKADTISGQKKRKQQLQEPASKKDWDKKIIRTAILNVEVRDYNRYYSSLREKVKALGGYIAQEEQSQSDFKIENSIAVKIPVELFESAVTQLTGETIKVNEKKILSQDVTVELIDTKSRMETKKQVRQRFTDLLRQAKNMQEILTVQSEINEIQEEIESAEGRIDYLGHASGYSTIHLTYFQILNASARDSEKPGFGTRLGDSFQTGWNWIGELFIGLVSIWPLFLILFIVIILYRRTRLTRPGRQV